MVFGGYYSLDVIQWMMAIASSGPHYSNSHQKTFYLHEDERQFVRKSNQKRKKLFFESLRWQLTERHENRKLQNKLLCWKNWLRLLGGFYSVDSTTDSPIESSIESNKERPIERLIEWLIESNEDFGEPAAAVSYGFWANRPGCSLRPMHWHTRRIRSVNR